MSKQMLSSFFPAHCSHIFAVFIPRTFEILYPPDVEEKCPEQTIIVWEDEENGVQRIIRRPFLAICALLGITMGFLWGLRLLLLAATEQNNNNKNNKKHQINISFILQQPTIYWSVAFTAFGMMNLSGLFLHCLTPPTIVSAVERPLLWIGDTYTTGVFGAALWGAAMMESLQAMGFYSVNKQYHDKTKWLIPVAWAAINVVGIAAIGYFLVVGYHDHQDDNGATTTNMTTTAETISLVQKVLPGTLPLEMWYFGAPVALGSHALCLLMICSRSKVLFAAFVLSYLMALIAFVDPWLCRYYGTAWADLLTTATMFFALSDAAFLGVGLWLEQRQWQRRREQQQAQQHLERKIKQS